MGRQKTQSAKEKYEKQKELARLRQRRRKERMTEEEKEAKRKYDRERAARLREEKKIKRINDMTPREQRKMRKYWRERHRAQKEKKLALESVVSITPPGSPKLIQNDESIQKKRGRKQVRKDKAKAYRTVKKQEIRIQELERKVEKYKKRLQREKLKMKAMPSSPSPRKQLKEILGKDKVSPNVKKQLFLGLAFRKQIETQMKEASKNKKKTQILRKVIGNKVLKRYRVQKYFNKIIPYKSSKFLDQNQDFDYRQTPKKAIRYKLSDVLTNFFENDTVSRMCPGKKDVVKQGRVKRQRRVLLDTIQNLYKRFLDETKVKISRTTFYRSRPFWVTFPKLADRDTCACIKHANMIFLVSALKSRNVIQERTTNDVIASTVCKSENENCMMGKCVLCNDKNIHFSYEEDFIVKFNKWVCIKEDKIIKNKKKVITKTVKSTQRKHVSEIKQYLLEDLKVFKKHVFYAKHQISVLQKLVKDLKPGSLIFRIDFSENYVAKFANEVQSVHFGASKKQIAINTGVQYASVEGNVKRVCFATASDNLDHQAHAVWAHMKPILNKFAQDFPETDTVHIFSDSPSSQYRNRINVYLMKTMMPQYFPKLNIMTWNWTEAGHGKGPMDGVGGTLKRGADQKVLHGYDITCANDFLTALQEFEILMFEIPSTDVERLKTVVSDLNIPLIKGIMNVHQATWCKDGKMQTRTLSCFSCPPNSKCDHYYHNEIDHNCEISYARDEQKSEGVVRKKNNAMAHVYTSSSEDEDPEPPEEIPQSCDHDLFLKYAGTTRGPVIESEIVSGAYVIVEYMVTNMRKKKEHKQFIGVCQSGEMSNEVDVLFMKPNSKDANLFTINDKDYATVPIDQIKAIIPTPEIILKGNRVFYKFHKIK